MRIIAGAWRGRTLIAPRGIATRPTADRMRQALFDMLLHAPWGGRALLKDARVFDVFAGTGAFGLEALSRGARHATFVESDGAALSALRANIAACRAQDRSEVLAVDILAVPAGESADLVFLDPPYRSDLLARAIIRLQAAGRVTHGTLLIAETARGEPPPTSAPLLSERTHGAARVSIWRETQVNYPRLEPP